MPQPIDEAVSVDLLSNHLQGRAYPWIIHWRGMRYRISAIGLHHTVYQGRVLLHMFSVTDGNTFFKLEFNTETLGWRLLEVEDNE